MRTCKERDTESEKDTKSSNMTFKFKGHQNMNLV